MITFHFHLQPQYKYELFHINFTKLIKFVSVVGRKHPNNLHVNTTILCETLPVLRLSFVPPLSTEMRKKLTITLTKFK